MHDVFTFLPQGNIYSRWRKKRVGDELVMEASYGKDTAGFCTGATIVWLKKSIASRGKGVLSAEELGSIHDMAIIQAMCTRFPIPVGLAATDIFPDLLSYINLDVPESMRGFGCFNVQNIFKWLSREPCHCLFAFCKQQAGHVLGLRNEGSLMQIFDIHYGLTQHTDRDQFIRDLYITAVLNHVCCVGGEWGVFKVNSAVD